VSIDSVRTEHSNMHRYRAFPFALAGLFFVICSLFWNVRNFSRQECRPTEVDDGLLGPDPAEEVERNSHDR